MRRLILALLLFAAACAPPPEVAKRASSVALLPVDLPPARGFPVVRAAAPRRSNADLAADFLDLEFSLETGRALPHLTRFEGPITYAVAGDAPPTVAGDLAVLASRLKSEAGITLTQATGPASITLNFLPRRLIKGNDPTVACFVVPGVSGWSEYQRARGSDRLDWAIMRERERIAIFIPADASPQEARDCLHEELAQAIGPLNDLYRLSDSIFNDDNFNTVLTGFDMLMLRLHYAPELASGMTREEVAARLPALLARYNPGGSGPATKTPPPTPDDWEDAMETALGIRGSNVFRHRAAQRALGIAQQAGWTDSRLPFSYFALGRASLGINSGAAVAAFTEAASLYRTLPGGAVHAAHAEMQLAAFALSQGWSDEAISLADRGIPVVTAAENASLLATFQLIKAEALGLQGRSADAARLRRESLGWARYGFGSGNDLAARISAIAALVPADLRG
jgi:Protein of unknown function (DUF2927)